MQLQYVIEFTIATAPQRFAKKWKHTKTTWARLLERLSKPTVTGETVAEYKAMKKSDTLKTASGSSRTSSTGRLFVWTPTVPMTTS